MKNRWWLLGIAAALVSSGSAFAENETTDYQIYIADASTKPEPQTENRSPHDQDHQAIQEAIFTFQSVTWETYHKWGVAHDIDVVVPTKPCRPNICSSARNFIERQLKLIAAEIKKARKLEENSVGNLTDSQKIEIVRAKNLKQVVFEDDPRVRVLSMNEISFNGDYTLRNPGNQLTIPLGRFPVVGGYKNIQGTVVQAFSRIFRPMKVETAATVHLKQPL